ncbi:tryptophan-rich sensory protein [Cellulophaga sp. 20_2_10]|uniref:tryptophan-rich sensory protein n=1 Tax=Cellulophaga sp. 20_2_10 TaxID=2942476 RepID=UPI00201B0AA5|nr:tryptophan-rich sensory protein [Cellulophaga sp. 20_2_10]MCL5247360.1 tryptophan-rich sensory protein [Cellulophaga sp. 20_2_10]
MKKVLQVANGVAFISTLVMNYLSNTGKMNGTTIGEVSGGLRSLFTPAGYAFSIWGLIYLFVFSYVIYQGRSLFVKVRDNQFVLKIGWWFVVSCIANCSWVVCWIYGYTGLSCIFIFLLLFSLLKIVWNNKMELWDAPISVITFLWWPFVIYSGWVAVASIANVSAYLVKVNWDGFGLEPVVWAVVMIVVAVVINLVVTWQRNMREFALVGAWALIAIAIANKGVEETLVCVAYSAAAVLILSSFAHAFKNRKTGPVEKLKEYFNK